MISAELSVEQTITDVPGGLDLLNAFALTGGKKFRPKLLLTISEAFGITQEMATPYAVAAERIHNATLLHDDVIDDSSRRRGKPTLNANGQNRQAVLGGDLLLAETLRDLAKTGNLSALQTLFDVLVELSEGEWLQHEARQQVDVSERHLHEVAAKKTGSLIAWCCATPALIHESAPVDQRQHKLLQRFGRHLGVAFQIVDDCVDFDTASGKPFAQDLREGQINFVIFDLIGRQPSFKTDIFLPSAIERLSRQYSTLLAPALTRTLAKAELEIAVAQALLSHSGFSPLVTQRIEAEVLEPFLTQLKIYRKKLL